MERSHTKPSECKEFLEKLREVERYVMAQCERIESGEDVSLCDIEARWQQTLAELGASATGEFLRRFDMREPLVVVQGVRYRRASCEPKTYRTLSGPVRVPRHVYRPETEPSAATLCPLELRAGLVAKTWTPLAAKSMARMNAELPARRLPALLAPTAMLSYSISSFEQVSMSLAEAWEDDRHRLEDLHIQALSLPEDAACISVSLDRVNVLMDERYESEHADIYDRRLLKAQLEWRQAVVGCVTVHDAAGEALMCLRYGRMPHESTGPIREQMKYDVKSLREGRTGVALIVLSDGAEDLCAALEEDYPGARQLVDLWHLLEHLAAAAQALQGSSRESRERLQRWKLRLLNVESAIYSIHAELDSVDQRTLKKTPRKALKTVLGYIERHHELMHYAQARARMMPVGSGRVEATCKQLVALRMKRNGQRWSLAGGQAILTLRSWALSDTFDDAMRTLLHTFKRQCTPVQAPRAA